MIGALLLLLVCAGASWLVADGVRRHAGRIGLVQLPNHRSSHELPTPGGGGLGIVASATLALGWLGYPFSGSGMTLLAIAGLALPLAVVGALDDLHHLPARVRFGIQAVTMAGLVFLIGELPGVELPGGVVIKEFALAMLFMLAGIWWVNLFNFMDGIDGIAGGQAVTMLLSGAGLAAGFNSGVTDEPTWLAMLCLAAAVFGFLALNWPPATLFMGDAGSTWLAFMLFALALLSVQAGWLTYPVWLILAAVFVSDATVTLLTRMALGERWYEAHRSHAYQRLARRWHGERKIGHRKVTIMALAINLIWLLPLAGASLQWPNWTAVWLTLAYGPLLLGAAMTGAGRPDHA